MLIFFFITLAIGFILFYDGYKKELRKETDKEVCMKPREKREKRKNKRKSKYTDYIEGYEIYI